MFEGALTGVLSSEDDEQEDPVPLSGGHVRISGLRFRISKLRRELLSVTGSGPEPDGVDGRHASDIGSTITNVKGLGTH